MEIFYKIGKNYNEIQFTKKNGLRKIKSKIEKLQIEKLKIVHPPQNRYTDYTPGLGEPKWSPEVFNDRSVSWIPKYC